MDWRLETGDWRLETGDWRLETGDWYPVLKRDWSTADPQERELQIGLSQFMIGAGQAKLSALDRTFKANSPILTEMVENYESYKNDGISKGAYDYRRRKLLTKLKSKIGPASAFLNGTQSPSEVLRISRRSGTAPTQPLTDQIKKMNRLSKVAKGKNVALSIVGRRA